MSSSHCASAISLLVVIVTGFVDVVGQTVQERDEWRRLLNVPRVDVASFSQELGDHVVAEEIAKVTDKVVRLESQKRKRRIVVAKDYLAFVSREVSVTETDRRGDAARARLSTLYTEFVTHLIAYVASRDKFGKLTLNRSAAEAYLRQARVNKQCGESPCNKNCDPCNKDCNQC